jgi:ribosomal protein L10
MRMMFSATANCQQDFGWSISSIVAIAIAISKYTRIADADQVSTIEIHSLRAGARTVGERLIAVRSTITILIHKNAHVSGTGHNNAPFAIDGQRKNVMRQFIVGEQFDVETIGNRDARVI